jgi:hypothetical protein
MLIVAQESIGAGSRAEGSTVRELEGAFEGRILLVERKGEGQTWSPPPDYCLAQATSWPW